MSEAEEVRLLKKIFKKQKAASCLDERRKYAAFQEAVSKNGSSIYSVINQFVDDYIQKAGE